LGESAGCFLGISVFWVVKNLPFRAVIPLLSNQKAKSETNVVNRLLECEKISVKGKI
jgi:hypothetical protein